MPETDATEPFVESCQPLQFKSKAQTKKGIIMAETQKPAKEKFKTMIGGQALIEGIMMRGPEKDAIVVRTSTGLKTEVHRRKLPPQKSVKRWPFIRGVVNFFDSQAVGVKALMRSADLAPEEMQEEPSKFDQWLEKRLGSEAFQKALVSIAVFMGLGLSILLFFLLPMTVASFFDGRITSVLGINLLEGLIRMVIFLAYMFLVSRMKEMRRVFSYHGAEHKTIRCYECGLPLTVENVRQQTRFHPRCGTSFMILMLFVGIFISMFISTPNPIVRTLIKLACLPVVVSIGYELIKLAGRYDNIFTRIISAPGKWLQRITTREPDDSMIECAIAAFEAVVPKDGSDNW